MKRLLLLPLLFFPVIVALIFEYNFCYFDLSRYYNFFEGILFGALLFGLISLMNIGRLRTAIFSVVYVLFSMSIWFESSFYYLYELNINPSTFHIVLQSGLDETKEFFTNKTDTTLIAFTLLFTLSVILVILFLVKQIRFFSWFINPPLIQKRLLIALVGIILFAGTIKLTGIVDENLPYRFVKTTYQFKDQSKANSDIGVTSKIGSFEHSIRKLNDNEETFVIIIGESLTRHKMSLYGYDRPTNPKLEAIQNELVVFKDVISPTTNTGPSLEKALTFNNYKDSTALDKGSLIQLFNSVGFKTFWISNQTPLNPDLDLVNKMATAADESSFINIVGNAKSAPYDEMLLPLYENALKDEYPKKVIFIHLLGNNSDYNNRFPKEFDVFKTVDDKYQEIEDVIDAYDNSVLYNDYLVNKMIEQLRKQDKESFLIMLASHGEEVYQTQDSFGHMEEDASQPMYDIPFILWPSKKFKENRPFRYRTYRKYVIDDLIHSLGHLANIKFDGYDASRSLFSVYFRNRTRIIQGDVDYDKLFE